MPFLPSLPADAGVIDLYRFDWHLAKPLILYQERLMRGPSPLTPAQRELIAAYVSGLNACRFCTGVHSDVARRFGIEAETLRVLIEEGPDAADLGTLAAILRYVAKLTKEPSRMVPADAEAVYAAGFDETALFHAVSICGLFNMFNRLVDGTGIDASAVDLGRLAGGLSEHGYAGRFPDLAP